MEQREKLIELMDGLSIDTHDDVISVVDWLIANGVVVLPCRCGECEHYDRGRDSCGRQVCMRTHFNGFCDFGERKGGDE